MSGVKFDLVDLDEILEYMNIVDDNYKNLISNEIIHVVDISNLLIYLDNNRGMNKSIMINKLLYDLEVFDEHTLIVINNDILDHLIEPVMEVFEPLDDNMSFYKLNTAGKITLYN